MNEWILALTIIIIVMEIIFITIRIRTTAHDKEWVGDKIGAFFASFLYYIACWLLPRIITTETGELIGINASFKYVIIVHLVIIAGVIIVFANKKIADFIHDKKLKAFNKQEKEHTTNGGTKNE